MRWTSPPTARQHPVSAMQSSSYLIDLNARLAEGVTKLPAELRSRHATYLLTSQNADGGFSGREGGSDLYYTGFALRGLAVLDALTPEVCRRASKFLVGRLNDQVSVVDFFSLLYSCFLVGMAGEDVLAGSAPDWPERVAAALESFRTPDGGYAKAVAGSSGSVYHTFLVVLSYELLGKPIPAGTEIVRFVHGRQRDDGGFVEIAPMKRSGTNPTAAAIGTLQILSAGNPSALPPTIRTTAADFLAAMAAPEGGLRGNSRAPVADLLSTFTGLWTLAQLNGVAAIDGVATCRFALAVEMPTGGFRGGLWDERADVEYTFYGLGCLGLLADLQGFSSHAP